MKVKRDLVGPALNLLAGELAVATEVTNMAIALGKKLLLYSGNIEIELYRGDPRRPRRPQGTFRPQATA